MKASTATSITYGDFLDAMREVTKDFPNVQALFEKIYLSITGYNWKERSCRPLSAERTEHFVRDISEALFDMICCKPTLETEGHDFLHAVRAKCVELGINVDDINFNPPLAARAVSFTRGDADLAIEYTAPIDRQWPEAL